MNEEDDSHDLDPDYKSKTQLKTEMTALQELGMQLVDLPKDKLLSFPISEKLVKAIADYKKISHKSAKRRQAQFIGKVMRAENADEISTQLDALNEQQHKATRQFHVVEKWRDRLLTNDDNALSEFFDSYPDADRQQLRTLLRAATKEKNEEKPPTHARKLFRFIQQLLESET